MMRGKGRGGFWLACFISAWVGQSQFAYPDVSIAGRCHTNHDGTTTSSALLLHGEIRKGDAATFAKMADELGKDTACPMRGTAPNRVPMIFLRLTRRVVTSSKH